MSKRLPRFYLEGVSDQSSLTITGDEFHHLRHVLRLGVGEVIVLFDGLGHSYESEIVSIHKDRAEVNTLKQCETCTQTGVSVTLAWALSKGKATDWLLQKATELGVTRLMPFVAQRSVVRLVRDTDKQIQNWRRATIEAAKQCGQDFLPEVCPPVSYEEFLGQSEEGQLRLIADPMSETLAREILKSKTAESVWVAVGPEGGFTEKEIESSKNAGFEAVSLGSNILRTETACLAFLAAIQYEMGG